MKIIFATQAWEDYLYWQTQDRKTLKRINLLIKDIARNPDDEHGIGKPERLKNSLSGYCSRRINEEHRLVYQVSEDSITIIQARHHY